MRQVIARSLKRVGLRERLWNDNVERWRHLLEADHPVRWAWRQHAGKRVRDAAMLEDGRFTHLRVVRLRSPVDARALVEAL